jgi:hypothetical protein
MFLQCPWDSNGMQQQMKQLQQSSASGLFFGEYLNENKLRISKWLFMSSCWSFDRSYNNEF